MKNIIIILVLNQLVFTNSLFSQSLYIKGFIKNIYDESVSADYKLIDANNVISEGDAKKLKIDLKLNNYYVLIISRKGFITKSILFSTFTKVHDDFTFEFDVLLEPVSNANNDYKGPLVNSFYVFYDPKLHKFNVSSDKMENFHINSVISE